MKCPKCGSKVRPNYKFCSKCDQPMDDAVANSVQKSSSENEKVVHTPSAQKSLGTIYLLTQTDKTVYLYKNEQPVLVAHLLYANLLNTLFTDFATIQ